MKHFLRQLPLTSLLTSVILMAAPASGGLKEVKAKDCKVDRFDQKEVVLKCKRDLGTGYEIRRFNRATFETIYGEVTDGKAVALRPVELAEAR